MLARDSEQLGVGVDPTGGRQPLLRAPWAQQTVRWGQDVGAGMSRSIQVWGPGHADADAAGLRDAEKTPETSTTLHVATAGCSFQEGGLPCTAVRA